MKFMTLAVRFILLATLIGMTAACGNDSADVAESEEEAHGHSHD